MGREGRAGAWEPGHQGGKRFKEGLAAVWTPRGWGVGGGIDRGLMGGRGQGWAAHHSVGRRGVRRCRGGQKWWWGGWLFFSDGFGFLGEVEARFGEGGWGGGGEGLGRGEKV